MPQTADSRAGPSWRGWRRSSASASAAGTANPESPDFYAELLRSRELLTEVGADGLRASGPPNGRQPPRHLIQLLRAQGRNPEVRLRRTLQKLRDRTDVSVGLKTGIITLRVQDAMARAGHPGEPPDARTGEQLQPDPAADPGGRGAASSSRAGWTRRRSELRGVEGELERLLRAEPELPAVAAAHVRRQPAAAAGGSPPAGVQLAGPDRTRTRGSRRSGTPPSRRSITPARRVGRGGALAALVLDLFLGLLLGLALALVIIFTREYLEAQRQRHPADYAEFASLRSSVFRSLARVASLGRMSGSSLLERRLCPGP